MSDLRDFTGKNRKNTGVAGERIAISSTANRVNEKGRLRYNESLELMEYYNGTTWISIDAPPSISGISPTSIDESDTTTTFTISGSNFSASGLQAAMFNESGSEIVFTTVTRVNDTTVTALLTNSNLGTIDEPYDIKITNGSGLSNTFADQINVNEAPAWSTSTGSLGTLSDSSRTGVSITVVATDPEGGDVDYAITVGALPSGLSFNEETGAITGTADAVGSNTTTNFTIQARDTASNIATRAFSITVNAPVVTSFTSTGAFTFNVPSGVSAIRVLTVAAGGGGGGNIAGAGGAGGMVEHSTYPVTPGGSVPGSVGAGGSAGQSRNSPGSVGVNTVFGSITANGGGSGGGGGSNPEGPTASHSGSPGGSGGGGGGYVSTQTQGTSTQSPSGGGTGYGNAGGAGGTDHAGGGGGGAGGAGQNSSGQQAGNGGVGRQNDINGTNHYWAGGGGGAAYNNNPVSGNGGLGGGGGGGNMGANVGSGGGSALNAGEDGLNVPSGPSTARSGGNAGTNTGGGGGGATHDQQQGGAGGPGIVVLSY